MADEIHQAGADEHPDDTHDTWHAVRGVTRRGAVVGLALLGAGAVVGHEMPRLRHTAASSSSTSPTDASSTSYVSTDLTAPKIETWKSGRTAAGLLFLDPLAEKGFQGVIVDNRGEPVWIAPDSASVTSPLNMTALEVQEYRGEPVLTYWSGASLDGHGLGEDSILDMSYRKVATVRAKGNTRADLHEFKLTDKGTALITVYPTRRVSLASIGGPESGYIFDCRAQEIDVATGDVLLDWSAFDHVGVDETYFGLTQHKDQDGTTEKRAFDPFHMNSIDDNGDRLLISMRHTHTVYAIDRSAGTVLWRFGGKKSDFDIPSDAAFAWQHDARWHGDNQISLFDNHVYSGPGESQGLFFTLDAETKQATLDTRLTYNRHRGTAMGSVQLQSGGNVLVGWGFDPAATEFDDRGRAVYGMTLPGASYRVRRHEWTGAPRTKPAIAAREAGSNIAVHLSWNGATEVSHWRVISASAKNAAKTSVVTPRTGFETTVLVAPADTFSAEALDKDGKVLGRTATVSV